MDALIRPAESTDVDGRAVGTLQAVRLSASEAWLQGLRVHPDHRGEGIGTELVHAGFSWASERGATVARAMVFCWNGMGLGLARAAGFEPATEFRWAHPVPDVDAAPETNVRGDPETAWGYWRESEACVRLAGLGLDVSESWALSTVTREQLRDGESGERRSPGRGPAFREPGFCSPGGPNQPRHRLSHPGLTRR